MRDQIILIADDDADFVCVLEKAFIEKDFKVYLVDNGLDALKQYYFFKPEIILMDIDMPGKNGWEVLKHIRQEDKQTPVVIMTGMHVGEDGAIKSYKDGATSFVRKTISYKEIVASVESLFRITYHPDDIHRFGNFTLNMSNLSLYTDADAYKLSGREARLLRLLVININQTVTTKDIVNTIWRNDIKANHQMTRNIISKLNKFIETSGNMHIKATYGEGYILS